MYRDYTQEEFWKLYKELPKNLQESLFSEETGNNIEKICRRFDIEDRFSEILNLTGQVLLGLLPVEEFEKVLIRDVDISMSDAREISREVMRFIFFPVKDDLTKIYGTGSLSEKKLEEDIVISKSQDQKDTYREPLE